MEFALNIKYKQIRRKTPNRNLLARKFGINRRMSRNFAHIAFKYMSDGIATYFHFSSSSRFYVLLN